MRDSSYWNIAVVLLGLISVLYLFDIVLFLFSSVPNWYFAYDEGYLQDAYYSSVNKETTNYLFQTFPMFLLFVISFFLFFTKNKFGFYLAAIGSIFYLAQTILAIMPAIDHNFGGLSLWMGAFLLIIAFALPFSLWKSRSLFKIRCFCD